MRADAALPVDYGGENPVSALSVVIPHFDESAITLLHVGRNPAGANLSA